MIDKMITELNNTASQLGIYDRVKFFGSDAVSVAREIAPYSKVAAIYSKSSFLDFGKDITVRLKTAGIKPLNFIMPENTTLNLSNVLDVICVPDDVRAMIVCDIELKDVAVYIATFFSIPVILSLRSLNTDGVFSGKVPFVWGGKSPETDFFKVDCLYYVVISESALGNGNAAEQFLSVYSKNLALIDYEVKRANASDNAACFKVVADAVNAAMLSCDEKTLFLSGLKIGLADLASGGEILANSAEYCFYRLIGYNKPEGIGYLFIKKLLSLYTLCALEKDMPFDLPDHIKRAKDLTELIKSNEFVLLKGFKEQLDRLKSKDLPTVKDGLKDRLLALSEDFDNVREKYISLGGKTDADFSPFINALKYCGDLPNSLNFMTIVRESGYTECF